MSGSHPQSPSAASTLAAALEKAARATDQAARHYLDPRQAPDPATVCAETWQLIHLLGAVSQLATTLAPHVGTYPQHYVLHTDDSGQPTQHAARACRELTALRHAVDTAERAAREVYTHLSHLNAHPRPERDGESSPGTDRRPRGR